MVHGVCGSCESLAMLPSRNRKWYSSKEHFVASRPLKASQPSRSGRDSGGREQRELRVAKLSFPVRYLACGALLCLL